MSEARMKVLIADDSAVYRSKIKAALEAEPWIEILGAVNNGKMALEQTLQGSVDLLVLDMEMPVMDGLTTLRELRKAGARARVIVFSSTTVDGSEATLEALASGADDFVTKPGAEPSSETPEARIRRDLLPKIIQFRRPSSPQPGVSRPPQATKRRPPRRELSLMKPHAIVIASSTGGPAAHDAVFSGMGGALRCPIFIAQHMPPVFTDTFAKRLSANSGLPCKEAAHGERVACAIYVAPGDYHLSLERRDGEIVTLLDKSPPRNFVRPAADPLFEAAAALYGKALMAFVLTGMGEDGLRGARAVRAHEGGIMIQDEQSCVVFGMPGALFREELYDAIGDLQQIRRTIHRMALE